MTAIDRNYVLSLLAEARGTEDSRVAFYRTQPYPAMTMIAADRVYSLSLLIEAVTGGLLDELAATHEQLRAEAIAEFARVAEAEADAHYAATLAEAELDAASRFPAEASPLSSTPLAVAFGAPGAHLVDADENDVDHEDDGIRADWEREMPDLAKDDPSRLPVEYFDEAEADDVRAIRREMAEEAGDWDPAVEYADEPRATAEDGDED